MEYYEISDDRVAWRVVEGEVVLVHADTSAYYGLNRSATEIWLALAEGPVRREELPDLLADRYRLGTDEVAPDVGEFLDALVAENLLTCTSGPPEPSGTDMTKTSGTVELPASYEPPRIEQFGELETLILSGE